MDLAVLIIVAFFQFGLRALMNAFVSLLGSLVSKTLFFVAITFARMISAFFFVLIIGPIWLIGRLFSHRSSTIHGTSIRTINNSVSPEEMEGNKAGKNGIPSDWVTVKLCGTDEISDFQLEDMAVIIAKTVHGVFEGWVGSWEERELFVKTKAEIDVKVEEWLTRLEA